ncbi:hypothetical protein FOMPIDRAFT_1130348, partial [Fomitopsis schrenkii]
FETLHFSWYNRHCTTGHSAPTDVQPLMMNRAGLSRTNHAQLIPYTSKDVADYSTIYEKIKAVLDDVFAWIDKQVAHMLPSEYEHLSATASLLPDNCASAVRPFVGLVINLNVSTLAHRDAKDDSICLVLAIGDFDGGELCLYEPGLLVPLRHGDFVVFPSCSVTHFNLCYTGQPASIVLHTDREMVKWRAEDRNGWKNNMDFL